MKARPKVSIITRTKNRPLFLERAFKSIYGQTFTDFEHIIVNDGGDPGVIGRLINEYQEVISRRVKVIHSTTSLGPHKAANIGLRAGESDYVVLHDDDDTWHQDFLAQTIACFQETDTAGVVVRAEKITEKISAADFSIKKLKSEQWMPDLKAVNLYRQCIDNQMTPITFIYKRAVLDEIGYYDENLPVLEDWDFGIRFLQKYDVEFLDPGYALAFYHHRKYNEGVEGNSTFGDSQSKHRHYSNVLKNKYLRHDLAQNRLGIGYIMNDLSYERAYIARIVSRLSPKFITERLRNRIYR